MPSIRYRTFTSRSGATLTFTAMGFGTAPLGNLYRPMSEEESDATLDAAWEVGCRYFDTAPLYGLGLSETRLNRFLRAKRPERPILSTKVGRILQVCDPAERTGHSDDLVESVLDVAALQLEQRGAVAEPGRNAGAVAERHPARLVQRGRDHLPRARGGELDLKAAPRLGGDIEAGDTTGRDGRRVGKGECRRRHRHAHARHLVRGRRLAVELPADDVRVGEQIAQEAEARHDHRVAELIGLDVDQGDREHVAGLGAFDMHRSGQRVDEVEIERGDVVGG